MFQEFEQEMTEELVRDIPLRSLALLGDAVFELFERERQLLGTATTSRLHEKVVSRVNAAAQAALLDSLADADMFTEKEADLIRRARNLKPTVSRKSAQLSYRKSTAFEALIGYLYLRDRQRLKEILDFTVEG